MIFGHPTNQQLQCRQSTWTKPNQLSLMPLQKWLPLPPTVDQEVLGEATEVVVVVVDAEPEPEPGRLQHLRPTSPGTRVPNILTSLQVLGMDARCIIGGEKELIFVLNPSPASGKTSSPPNLQRTNEKSTSSAK